MEIKSLGPMVAVFGDEELDRELERRRLRDKKIKAGPVDPSELGKEGGMGSATDSEHGGAAIRLATFLKQFPKGKGEKQKSQAGHGAKRSVEPRDLSLRQKDQRRKKALAAYRYQTEFEGKISLKGLNLVKSVD